MKKLNFEEKVKGCLVGSVIGAELGFAKHVHPEWFNVPDLKDIFKEDTKDSMTECYVTSKKWKEEIKAESIADLDSLYNFYIPRLFLWLIDMMKNYRNSVKSKKAKTLYNIRSYNGFYGIF